MPYLSKELKERIWEATQRHLSGEEPINAFDQTELRRRICLCGRTQMQAYAHYAPLGRPDSWRLMEVMSIRYRGSGGKPLLYAWCHKDQAYEAFRLDRFLDFQVTQTPYSMIHQYPIEVAGLCNL